MSTLFRSLTGDNENPLRNGSPMGGNKMTYELMNKKAGSNFCVLCLLSSLIRGVALQVCESFVSSSPRPEREFLNRPRPFIYLSAEDIFRPLIPARYIETKREAEQEIEDMVVGKSDYRGVYIRPSSFPLVFGLVPRLTSFSRPRLSRPLSASDNTWSSPARPIRDTPPKSTSGCPNTFQCHPNTGFQ